MARRRSAWDEVGESLGNVEILGEPAEEVEVADEFAVKYKGKRYKNADKINIGVSGTQELDAYSGTGPGVPFQFQVAVSTPSKVYKVTIPSFIAPFLVISQVTIGPWRLVDGQPISADIWSEVSRNNSVNWPTAETSQNITFSGESFATAAVAMRQPRITLFAIRLR
jgi:hypothetical protein